MSVYVLFVCVSNDDVGFSALSTQLVPFGLTVEGNVQHVLMKAKRRLGSLGDGCQLARVVVVI